MINHLSDLFGIRYSTFDNHSIIIIITVIIIIINNNSIFEERLNSDSGERQNEAKGIQGNPRDHKGIGVHVRLKLQYEITASMKQVGVETC